MATKAVQTGIVIRDAQISDMDAIRRIYAPHVLRGLATFEEAPPGTDEMTARWRVIVEQNLPYLVAERQDGIIAYAYASAYRPRRAYRYTVEDSIYVAEDHVGQGIGRDLLATLIARCEAGSWRQMIAVIGDSGNFGSIALHERLGFHHIGTFRSIGYKLGRWVDTVLMQRELGPGGALEPDGVIPAPARGR